MIESFFFFFNLDSAYRQVISDLKDFIFVDICTLTKLTSFQVNSHIYFRSIRVSNEQKS